MTAQIEIKMFTTEDGATLQYYVDPEIGDTVATMFWARVSRWGGRVAMRDKNYGIWEDITWRRFGDAARAIGLGLTRLGVGKGDVVCILSNTNPEWMYVDMGALSIGAVAAGIYPTDASAQVEYLLNDSSCQVIFVEDEEQLDKVLAVRERCPSLKKIVIFDMEGLRDLDDPTAIGLEAFIQSGRAYDEEHQPDWNAMVETAKPGDLAILVYTSGTTGPPKGAMISHHNLVFQCVNGARVLDHREGDNRIAFLPLCHVAERVFTYYSFYTGVIVNFVENPDTVPENVREVQPDFMLAVPRIWEKFYSAVLIALADATPLQRWAYARAIAVGYRLADAELAGRTAPAWLRLAYRVAYWLVLKNIRRMIGIDRCRWAATGAAPIAPDLIRWYHALGVEMLEVYGQTENTGLATSNVPGAHKIGTVGKCVPYAELKISRDGEILLRGDHVFMGYYNNPEKTAETIVDGWLRTGDVGYMDNEGFVKITDRMKDIIITAGGKNITPSEIENELKFSPYIADAVVIGERRKYLTCLIMIDQENVEKFAQDHNIPFTNFASLTRAPEIVTLIEGEVEAVNRKVARVESIKKFKLIDHQLDPEDEELTPTMKLKRRLVNEKYKPLIEAMYAGA